MKVRCESDMLACLRVLLSAVIVPLQRLKAKYLSSPVRFARYCLVHGSHLSCLVSQKVCIKEAKRETCRGSGRMHPPGLGRASGMERESRRRARCYFEVNVNTNPRKRTQLARGMLL